MTINMLVNEIFYSLQGEGMLAGTPSVFVRLAGCPFRCRWCDTAYAWDYAAGEELGPDEIVAQVQQWPCGFIVLTGGEPMAGPDLSVRPGLVDLTHRLKDLGQHITIETTGSFFVPDLACNLLSISPKLSNSVSRLTNVGCAVHTNSTGADRSLVGTGHPTDLETVRRLMDAYPYQLKFVVEAPDDIGEVRRALTELGEWAPERVLLMPQAATTEELLRRSPMVAEACKQTGLRFGPRLHIQLWGQRRGT